MPCFARYFIAFVRCLPIKTHTLFSSFTSLEFTARHNQLSQLNILLQLKHLKTYRPVQEASKAGRLRLHGWWFELQHADVLAYEASRGRFVLVDEEEAGVLLQRFT